MCHMGHMVQQHNYYMRLTGWGVTSAQDRLSHTQCRLSRLGYSASPKQAKPASRSAKPTCLLCAAVLHSFACFAEFSTAPLRCVFRYVLWFLWRASSHQLTHVHLPWRFWCFVGGVVTAANFRRNFDLAPIQSSLVAYMVLQLV